MPKGTDKAPTAANGNKYVGEYRDGKRNGQGITPLPVAKYVGEYRDNQRHGQGTYTFADGTKFVGEYRDDKRHGQLTVTYAMATNALVSTGMTK